MDDRSKFSIKIDALQRYVMVNTCSSFLPLYIVAEYPKSGGSWVAQMLSAYLELPFPRNQRPRLESCIIHGHMLYSASKKNVICVMRDGRDIMTSLYYHRVFQNEKNHPGLVERTRQDLSYKDFDDINHNLPHFIEYVHTQDRSSRSPFQFTWSDFVNSWTDQKTCIVKYEDLIDDCRNALNKIISHVSVEQVHEEKLQRVIERYSFAQQAKRQPGEEIKNSFLRKGQPGDWKEKFSKKAARVFHDYSGNELIKLGYVKDDSWIEELN